MDKRTAQGMTLVEILVALGIFLMLLGVMVPNMLSTTTANTRNEQLSTSVRMATTQLEAYRAQLGTSVVIPLSGTTTTTTVDRGVTYTVTSIFCPNDAPAGMICSANARYIRVQISNGSRLVYTAESFFTQLD